MGIATYEAVADSADAILGEGRNPTVLAIRDHLGGGSPNTILKHLNAWRETLGPRLLEVQRRANTPAVVVEAMASIWDAAMAAAMERATAELSDQQHVLANDREHMEAEQRERREREQLALTENARLRQAMEALEAAQPDLHQRIEQARLDLRAEQERARQALTDVGKLSAELATQRGKVDTLEDRLEAQREAERAASDALLTRIDKLSQDLKRASNELRASEAKRLTAEAGRNAAEARSAELSGRVKGMESSNVTLADQLRSTRSDLAKLAAKRTTQGAPKRPAKKKA